MLGTVSLRLDQRNQGSACYIQAQAKDSSTTDSHKVADDEATSKE